MQVDWSGLLTDREEEILWGLKKERGVLFVNIPEADREQIIMSLGPVWGGFTPQQKWTIESFYNTARGYLKREIERRMK